MRKRSMEMRRGMKSLLRCGIEGREIGDRRHQDVGGNGIFWSEV